MTDISSFGAEQAGGIFDPLDPKLRAAEQAGLGDVSVENLVLDVASARRKGLDARIDGKLEDGTIILSMSEAPSLSLTMTDPSGEALTSGLFAYKLNLELDNVPFRLVEIDGQDDDYLVLKSEHLLVAYCREHSTPKTFSRGHYTRAEAARALVVGEIKALRPRFVSPDLHKTQKLARADVAAPSQKGGGFADGAAIQRADGHVFTPTQLRNAQQVLDQCAKDAAPPKATLAVVEACIVEGPNFENPLGGEGTSSGILQLTNDKLGGSTSTKGGRRDITLVVHDFLTGTGSYAGHGGAIPTARANPGWTAGQVAQRCQGSDFPKRYDKVRDVAQRVIDHYQGGGASFGGGKSYWKTYEFTRGQANKREDTWVCTGRWADEVRWRRFVVGQRSFYFVDDDQLMRSKPRYLIDPTTTGLLSRPTFTLEVGGRTIVVRGRREQKPSECSLSVRLDRWAAGPGSVIELADYGPLDGRWLVDSVERNVFDATGTVRLRQPQKALPEPRSQQATKQGSVASGSASSGAVYGVYREAQRISKRGLPYGPGGHGQTWSQAARASSLDCSSSTSLALHAGGLMQDATGPQVSSYFLTWGSPGRGEQMTVWVKPGEGANGHVFIEFYGKAAKRFDTVPAGDGENGPRMRRNAPTYIGLPSTGGGARQIGEVQASGQVSARGYVPRHYHGT